MRQQQDEPGRFSICSRQAAVVHERETRQPEESDVKKQLSRKHEQGHNIGFALEHGFTKDSEEHKKLRIQQERNWKGLGF
ncbi:hypothetical protein BW690_23015 [Escherichia coli]|nr:hypothetical protein BW690_23015 [Escherichia coli]